MFRSAVGKFEGVRIHFLNDQQFGTLRRSSQRGGGKTGGKGGAVAMDSSSVSELAMQSVLDTTPPTESSTPRMPVLRSEDMLPDSAVVGAVTTSDGTIQQPAEGTLPTMPIQTYCKVQTAIY